MTPTVAKPRVSSTQGTAPAKLPKMPALGASIDAIADKAESMIHAISRGAQSKELNQIREEGVGLIKALHQVYPQLLDKNTTAGYMAMFDKEVPANFNRDKLSVECVTVLMALRPLASALAQRSVL